MICVACNSHDTTPIDDMQQPNYIAEIFKCNICKGTIEVIYHDKNMNRGDFKNYVYISKEGSR